MEACELVWNDAKNIHQIKIAMEDDTSLKPILAFI